MVVVDVFVEVVGVVVVVIFSSNCTCGGDVVVM